MAYATFLSSQMITRNWSRWDSDITRQSQVDSVILSKNLPGGGFGRRLKFSPQCKPSSTSLRSSLPQQDHLCHSPRDNLLTLCVGKT